jgi:hypothetical protein
MNCRVKLTGFGYKRAESEFENAQVLVFGSAFQQCVAPGR